MANNFGGFDIDKYIEALKGGDVGTVGKFAGGAIEHGFKPRYRRAAEGVYGRGFDKRGSTLGEVFRPVDQDLLSTLITQIPNLYSTQEGLRLQEKGLDIQRLLGERRLSIAEEEQHQRRTSSGRGLFGHLFG